MLLSAAADLARGAESRCLGCCLLLWFSSWFVSVGYLMTPFNPYHTYPYIMSSTMLNFKALQWITLRNKVGNLSPLNLNSAISKGTFFLLEDMLFQETTHPFGKALCLTLNISVNNSKTQSIHPLKHFLFILS